MINTGLLLFAGVSGLMFLTRPVVLSYAAFAGFVVYALMSWKRMKREPMQELEIVIPALVVLIDLLVSFGTSAYSAILIMSNLILLYLAYQTWRDSKVGSQLDMRARPKRTESAPG